ncbi:MAG: polysaccharide biosynthesis C-terminal domain-containing protein [Paludibacteraceae bacterium]|nr:polysaccharide biosynthesis C-terminal domain-containing protein [Paludibacteraceae bacterium]MBP9039482.1 polysaccharide biosynthesis C-terminal domain-containing protein [Paludibacteraceae bacterium]MDI9537679.1 oligosaccharide flippase family protein [Bacteroidota bacterium]
MAELKTLAKETAIYGVSSIIGRFLNWCLVPLYSYVLVDSGDYGIVTNLYAWTALVVIILTYGMETGFFRFINKQPESERSDNRVYSTTLTSVGTTSIIFSIVCIVFGQSIANALGYGEHPEFIWMLGVVVSMDAFDSIPFSYLRYKNKPIVFASLKLLMIFVNILFNIFFLVLCPIIAKSHPEWISWFYNPDYGVGYIFVANFISTTTVTLALLPYVFVGKWNFDGALLRSMLKYSLPLLLLGIAGIMNQSIDKIIFPMVYPDPAEGMRELGIYGACFKVAMVMMMFTYAFRFAYEPFVFAKNEEKDSKTTYADAMKYFVITTLLIFLCIVAYIDVFQLLLGPRYRAGIRVVPIVLMAYFFQGVMYNLSLWYKLVDRTMFGALFSLVGLVITLIINILFIPVCSYMACAWASLVSAVVMVVMSYAFGQKYYPINYDLKRIGFYFVLSMVLFAGMCFFAFNNVVLNILYRTLLVGLFVAVALWYEWLSLQQNFNLRRKH